MKAISKSIWGVKVHLEEKGIDVNTVEFIRIAGGYTYRIK